MRPKNICLCKSVSEKTLVDTIHSGTHDLQELINKTGASTKCGSCLKQVSKIFEREMNLIEKSKSHE